VERGGVCTHSAPARRQPRVSLKGVCGLITAALISVARPSLARKSIGELQGVGRLANGAGVGDGRELVPVRFGVAASDPANDPEGVGFVAEEPGCVNQRWSGWGQFASKVKMPFGEPICAGGSLRLTWGREY